LAKAAGGQIRESGFLGARSSGKPHWGLLWEARGQRASLWRSRRPLKLAPLGRPIKATASAAQAPPPPPSGGSKRPPSPGGPPPATPARAQQHGGVRFCQGTRQPEQNSTAGFAFTERARWQPEGTRARRRALLDGATSTARAQQHGGVRFHRAAMAPRQQPEHNSTAACASAGAAMAARAQQHGGVRFCRAPRQQPEKSSTYRP
jgi:hypothetical protein